MAHCGVRRAAAVDFDETFAVTLEISAVQYFPFLIAEAKEAIEKQNLMPGRYIRVRNMVEQSGDNGDIMATAAVRSEGVVDRVWFYTGDKDFQQLLDERTGMLKPGRRGDQKGDNNQFRCQDQLRSFQSGYGDNFSGISTKSFMCSGMLHGGTPGTQYTTHPDIHAVG